MHPLAAVLLPVSAIVLAGTTVSAVGARPPGSAVEARPPGPAVGAPPPGSAVPAVSSGRAVMGMTGAAMRVPAVASPATGGRFGPVTAPAARAVTSPGAGGAVVGPGLRDHWAWPLYPQPPVVRPFLRPPTRYGAGHRGVDLAGTAGQDILAVEGGTVTHVGRIAGRGTLTVVHASGVRSTYEPVSSAVTTGSVVGRGTVIGRLEQTGSHCGSAACLHLGAIRGGDYLDPLVFLTGARRVRLLSLVQAPDG